MEDVPVREPPGEGAEPKAVLGAVSVTLLSRHASAVLRSVRDDPQTVAISRRGVVVAVLLPLNMFDLVLKYGELELSEVSARELDRGNTSGFVARAEAGERIVVTHQNRPVALLGPLSEWHELDDFRSASRLGDPAGSLDDDAVLRPDVALGTARLDFRTAYQAFERTGEVEGPTATSS